MVESLILRRKAAGKRFEIWYLRFEKMKAAGCRFRNEIVVGNGGKQVLVDDPSGNPVELFEPPK